MRGAAVLKNIAAGLLVTISQILLCPPSQGVPSVKTVRMFNMKTDSGPTRYDATSVFNSRTITLDVPTNVTVQFRLQGESGWRSTDLASEIRDAAARWTTILHAGTTTGQAVVLQVEENGTVPIRTRDNIWNENGVAVTFAPGRDLGPAIVPQDVPATGAIFIRNQLEIPPPVMQRLQNWYGTQDVEQAFRHFMFANMMHEFGHLLGIDHPAGNAGSHSTTIFELTQIEPFQLMHRNILAFLTDLHDHVGGRALTDADITPAPGELATLLEIINQHCYPDPDVSIVLAATTKCSVPRVGISYDQTAYEISSRIPLISN